MFFPVVAPFSCYQVVVVLQLIVLFFGANFVDKTFLHLIVVVVAIGSNPAIIAVVVVW